MTRFLAPCLLVALAAGALPACQSTQSKSERLKAASTSGPKEQGLSVSAVNPDVKVTATTVLNDAKAKRTAAVITLRNTSGRPLAALPLLFTVTDAGGKKVFSNDSAGASTDLTTVPSLPAGGTLEWVNDAIVNVSGASAVTARVGVAPARPPDAAAPKLRLSKVRLDRDPIDGVTASGRVFNSSSIAQERLVIFATARRSGKIVAAGRAIVPVVNPGPKGVRFTVFFVGDPSDAKLDLHAPPVSFGR